MAWFWLLLALRHCLAVSDNNTAVLNAARKLLKGTFNAGGSYADIWARDTNTFVEVALDSNPASTVRSVLIGFFCRQKSNGECPGGYTPHTNQAVCYGAVPPPAETQYKSCLGGTELCKNNAETDQETSIVQAVHSYVTKTGDISFLSLVINGTTVLDRCGKALRWLRSQRTDAGTGLLWGGTTLDWGDCQPEPDLTDYRLLDKNSHPAIDVYDNAMFVMAVEAYLAMLKTMGSNNTAEWENLLDATRKAIREHLWTGNKFKPHVYMNAEAAARAAAMSGLPGFKHGSPFADTIKEELISYHGGTACAGLAKILSAQEFRMALQNLLDDVAEVNAAHGDVTVGLTIYPPYNVSYMPPYTYQNGGDWAWFGGRIVSALVKYGLLEEAATVLKPMVDRVVQHNGFWEWWSREGRPSGSNKFHGAAGVLGSAILELHAAREAAATLPSEARMVVHI